MLLQFIVGAYTDCVIGQVSKEVPGVLKTTERIVTVSDLQRNAGAVVLNARVQPVAVTRRGRPIAYLVGVDLFDEMASRLVADDEREMVLGVEVSEKQFAAGESVTLEELEIEFGNPVDDK